MHPKLDGWFAKRAARVLGAKRPGWHPRPYDSRDHVAETKHNLLQSTPTQSVFSLRGAASQVPQLPFDQLSLGSCVGNAIVDNAMVAEAYAGARVVNRSRLYAYYNARLPGPVSDDGCDPRAAANGFRRYGICTATQWPYVEGRVNKQPTASAYMAARTTQGASYSFLASSGKALVGAIKSALVQGLPVCVGILVGDTFDNAHPYKPIELPDSATIRGGHYVTIVGWDDTRVPGTTCFEVLNSWGNWCDQGYGLLAEEVITDVSSGDFLVLSGFARFE